MGPHVKYFVGLSWAYIITNVLDGVNLAWASLTTTIHVGLAVASATDRVLERGGFDIRRWDG